MFITFACQNKHIDDWKYVNYMYCYVKPFHTSPAVPDDRMFSSPSDKQDTQGGRDT